MASLIRLLKVSFSLAMIREEEKSRVCPVSLRWSPTAVVDALLMLSCSLRLTPNGLAVSPMYPTDTSSRRSTGLFCHVVFTILNHVTKHPTPSLDKDSATELKACDLAKFLDPEKKNFVLFCCNYFIDNSNKTTDPIPHIMLPSPNSPCLISHKDNYKLTQK